MSSASKSLELLEFFSPERLEIGLSQLCRLAGRDKATTYRYLQSLEMVGLVAKNLATKQYRLGSALLQLAQTRELTVPRKAGVDSPLRALADETGETGHVSVLSGKMLYKLEEHESLRHSIRVVIDIQTFPLHATASGLCALAFGPEDLLEVAMVELTSYTSTTATDPETLYEAIKKTRTTGFGRSEGSLEADVYSLGAPLFDQADQFAGAVSVASVVTRFTPELEHLIQTHLITARRAITHNWGGTVPAHIEQAWSTGQASASSIKKQEPTR